MAYQAADWSTNFSLNILSRGLYDCKTNSLHPHPNYVAMAIWAPLFLLHLCSPDTITAYSLEDNELWLRNLFGLGRSFGLAIYILKGSWTGSPINYLAIPVLLVAMVKFAERNLVQYMASSNQFRDSMLQGPDPGPNYAKFMDAHSAKEAEGFVIYRGPLIETPLEEDPFHNLAETDIPDDEILRHAYSFFETFKKLFADLILSFQDYKSSRSFFHKHSSDVAFKVVEIELGFVYDVLYTKAIVIYSRLAIVSRLISFSLITSVFFVYLFKYWHDFSETNMIITCSLLAGGSYLEFYEMILFFSSDWTRLWLDNHKNLLVDLIVRTISFSRSLHLVPADKRWSDHLHQYNLLSFCLKEKSATRGIIRKFFHAKLEKYMYKTKTVPPELKKMIFNLLKEKSVRAKNIKECKELCAFRGGPVLKNAGRGLDKLDWSIEVEFDQSILLWHIATDLCYYEDLKSNPNLVENSKCKISKILSDYMLYLLVMCPFMLPNGIGQIRFQDTCAEAIEFLQEWKAIRDIKQACEELLLVNTKVLPNEVKGDRSKSVLFDACRLAKALKVQEKDKEWTSEQMWEVMTHVWIEMLCYAACHCQWRYHARQLTNGGELLTHVSLLMAHLGLSEQFQISEGHGRVKLLVS
ncbi:hypothetical protein Acr_00g0021840 [Actinidia rufa]|uniref:DUF4220 domain-containing protein n=1 Tax=Actinidia rufa TaxID=165716 RepID=A0A7J0DCD2_9ERIC|nr:hypothetical protein Acr_00g0021840 [Actinidia rufa]